MTVEIVATLGGIGMMLTLVGLAVMVQLRRPPEDGTSTFVIVTGFVVFIAACALFTKAGI